MIRTFKIDSQSIVASEAESPAMLSCDQTAYASFTSWIEGLHQHHQELCVLVRVIDFPSMCSREAEIRKFREMVASFSRREMEVFQLAVKGRSNREISEALSICLETVKSHRKKIVIKAGVRKIEDMKDLLLKINLE